MCHRQCSNKSLRRNTSILHFQPAVRIVSFRRSDNSVSQFGISIAAKWKPDNSMLAVTVCETISFVITPPDNKKKKKPSSSSRLTATGLRKMCSLHVAV